MNAIQLAEIHLARAEIHAVVRHAVYFSDNAQRIGILARDELAEVVAVFAADAMRDAILVAQAKDGPQ